ncbi:hypothetical protein IFM89_038020 [Coptis chinensis]|uniref:Uncharacterized protein n=1 Tax=Coptis chinensis TaxID=261450 RepID=A0A835HT89_9MAGN|nr:hypothetical protein IFM89_038020 [Coptis chinensis]
MLDEVEEIQEEGMSLRVLLKKFEELEKQNKALMAKNKAIREDKERREVEEMYEKDGVESSSCTPVARKSHPEEVRKNHLKKAAADTSPLTRQQKKRRNRKNNKNGPQETIGVSGAKDTQRTSTKEQEQGEILQDSTSELEETTHLTDIIEAQDPIVAPIPSIQSPGTHRTVEMTRTSREAENTVNKVIVYDQSKEQADVISNEGEHAGCEIRCTERRVLWEELSLLGLNTEAWAMAGDFNAVTSTAERKGGRLPCQTAVNEFVNFINANALLDSTNLGFNFSWSNKRHGNSRMLQKFDRILINKKWLDAATGWKSKILQRRFSNHSPIIGWFTSIPKPHNIPFRFNKHWIKHESLKAVVKMSWDEPLEDVPIRKIMKKLKRLKETLKIWSWETFGDLRNKKERAVEELELI